MVPRRKLVWATLDTGVNIAANNSFQNIDLLQALKVSGAGGFTLGSTVVRTHLALHITSTVATGDGLYLGEFVGTNDEVGSFTAATGTNVPNPSAQPEADWMMWEHRAAAPQYNYEASNNHVIWDIKSKRKLEELQQTLIFSILANGVGTLPLTGLLTARALVALP
jgi:hypothetical protein